LRQSAQREISIAFPPDLSAMLHFGCMRDRLLDRATVTSTVQHFDRLRSYIIH
jgi:hypothetical protein